jgi:hypothetical protein
MMGARRGAVLDLELFGAGDSVEVVVRPGSHQIVPTRTKDLIARRSSIAA